MLLFLCSNILGSEISCYCFDNTCGADVFVPPEMARECYEACQIEKQLIFYEGATHAQSNFRHPEKYENDLLGFADRVCNANNS